MKKSKKATNRKKVSCIISAYNEGERIANVLKTVENHPLLYEVIVVNDDSKDNTSDVVRQFKSVKLVEHPINKGKTRAMVEGATVAKSDIICFIDADLINLNEDHITKLVQPVIDGKVDMTLSLKDYPFPYSLMTIDFLSGERCMHKNLFFKSLTKAKQGWSVESQINEYVLKNNLKFAVVRFKKVPHLFKTAKSGFIKGSYEELYMWFQIFKVVPPHKELTQMFKMAKRKTTYKKLYSK